MMESSSVFLRVAVRSSCSLAKGGLCFDSIWDDRDLFQSSQEPSPLTIFITEVNLSLPCVSRSPSCRRMLAPKGLSWSTGPVHFSGGLPSSSGPLRRFTFFIASSLLPVLDLFVLN